MQEEEACNLKTPTEICIQKIKGIPGNMKGVSAPKKHILAFEKIQIVMNKETERANDAEERSAILLDKVSAQEKLLLSLEEKMNAMAKKNNTVS